MSVNVKRDHLLVFGYGLAMFISFIVIMHELHLGLGFWPIIGMAIVMLVILNNVLSTRIYYYIWMVGMYGVGAMQMIKHPFSVISSLFIGIAIGFLIITNVRVERLKPIYKVWMKVAHFIGNVISGFFLSVLFYVVFGIAGIVLRILNKDLLDQAIDPSCESYWIKREQLAFDKESYTKQF